MKLSKKEILTRELEALGEGYRNDWSMFDGRVLQSEIQSILNWFNDETKTKDFNSFSKKLEDSIERKDEAIRFYSHNLNLFMADEPAKKAQAIEPELKDE